MLFGKFRPWGDFNWATGKLGIQTWDFLGCLSTEDRFSGALTHAVNCLKLDSTLFIKVIDDDSDYADEAQRRFEINGEILENILTSPYEINEIRLLESPILIKSAIENFLVKCNGNVLFDISCFPKRFFFPILKVLLKSERVENLSVCYTTPERYFDGPLADDPLPWGHIPMFQRSNIFDTRTEHAIVGVGFMPLSLPSLLKSDYIDVQVTLLFPFPPGPPNYQRTWEFVRDINSFYPLNSSNQIVRVGVHDVPGCYDHLNHLTNNGSQAPCVRIVVASVDFVTQ